MVKKTGKTVSDMQFSVIVESPFEGEPTNEDALLELERFLRASGITTEVINELKNGRPQVLKNKLSYEQAVKISDRLMDLGLDSIIDPPIKPDDDEEEAASNVTPINRDVRKKAANKSTTQKHSASLKAKRPSLSVVDNKNKNTGDYKKSRKPTKTNPKQLLHKKQQLETKQQQQKPQAKTTSSSNLSQAASNIKSLFHLSNGGAVDIDLPRSSRLKLNLVASLCFSAIALYGAVWLSVLYIGFSLTGFLFSAIAEFSVVLALIISAVPLALLVGSFALINLPFLPKRKNSSANLVLRAKDEPKLFMLVTAIGKVFKAPAPTTLILTATTRVKAKQSASLVDFFKLNKPLEGDIQITMGAPLIQNLSIRDFSSLVAKEIGIYGHTELRRPQWVIQNCMEKIVDLKTPHPTFNIQLSNLNQKLRIGFIQKMLAKIAKISDALQLVCCTYFQQSDRLIKNSFSLIGPIASRYQFTVLDDKNADASSASELVEVLSHIDAYHELTLEEVLGDDIKSKLPNSLPKYCQYLMQRNKAPSSIGEADKEIGLIRSAKPIRALFDKFDEYAFDITKQYYQSRGVNTENHELCSLKSLFQQEAKEQKLSQASLNYFGEWQHPLQFWRLPAENLLPVGETESIINRLNNCIARVRYASPDRQTSLNRYDKLIQLYAEMRAAKKVIASGNTFTYQRCSESAQTLDRDLAQRKTQIKELQDEIRQQNAIMGERIALGLLLDKQRKDLTPKIFKALAVCHGISEKTLNLLNATEELSHLLRHKPKNQAQQFQLYTRELSDYIRDSEKGIRRKLAQCPFEMIDSRYKSLSDFIAAQESDIDSLNLNREQFLIARAKNTLAAINWAYGQINQRVAFIASNIEEKSGIETIKKTDNKLTNVE